MYGKFWQWVSLNYERQSYPLNLSSIDITVFMELFMTTFPLNSINFTEINSLFHFVLFSCTLDSMVTSILENIIMWSEGRSKSDSGAYYRKIWCPRIVFRVLVSGNRKNWLHNDFQKITCMSSDMFDQRNTSLKQENLTRMSYRYFTNDLFIFQQVSQYISLMSVVLFQCFTKFYIPLIFLDF